MMKIKNNYDCEKCLNKSVCKYYDNCKHNSNKDLFVKPKKERGNHTAMSDNLTLSITCKYYKPEQTTLYRGTPETGKPYSLNDYIDHSNPFVYPEPKYNYTGTGYCENDTCITLCDNGSESNKNNTTVITDKKHI